MFAFIRSVHTARLSIVEKYTNEASRKITIFLTIHEMYSKLERLASRLFETKKQRRRNTLILLLIATNYHAPSAPL